jgi:eukaryotic-like serine/threonine-protein kinase
VAAAPELSGVTLDDRYRLVERLADGAMGSVYRGERVGLGREVAIKLMHATLPGELSARERFEREAQLMAKLAHPHCVSVIDKPYLVMELAHGDSLHQLLVRENRLSMRRAADIARQALAGIAHAHALDIIHRDIKPANIMVSPKEGLGDHVQILDFGLARLHDSGSLLTVGFTVGTPSYMAPEQCRGAKLDGRVDLYACGVVLFEMITGRTPFVASDPLAIVTKHLTEPPPRLCDVTHEDHGSLEDVVARALAKNPDERYASAVEMAAAIDEAIPGLRVTPAPTPIPAAIADIPVLGSSALVPIEEPSGPAPLPLAEPSALQPPRSAVLHPHEASMLRRMLPPSRMKWVALLLLIFVVGGIYGIIRAKQYLAEQAAEQARARDGHAAPR